MSDAAATKPSVDEVPMVAFDKDAVRRLADTICRGAKHSERRTRYEALLTMDGQATIEDVDGVRAMLYEARAQRLISGDDYQTLNQWVTRVIDHATTPTMSLKTFAKATAPGRPLKA